MADELYIIWLQNCDKTYLPTVGGKNASLGEMLRANIRVPPGFAVTTAAYRDFLNHAGMAQEIQRILAGVDAENIAATEQASITIRQLMGETPIPARVEDAVRSAYEMLAEQCGVPDLPVAVRSSATAEDLPGASFAGQQETTLWVRRAGVVLVRTAICWSSLFTPRAISYRIKMGFPHEKVQISVGIQKMVHAHTAGVMFTLNPTNGDRSKVVIDASWGLGETVVSGMVTPDNYVVDKVSRDILRRTISPKLIEYVPNPDGRQAEMCDVPPERQNSLCLSDDEVLALVDLAKRIEAHYGAPQDIEWAIDRDLPFPSNVMILQCRPETVWSRKQAAPVAKGMSSALDYVVDNLLAGVRPRRD